MYCILSLSQFPLPERKSLLPGIQFPEILSWVVCLPVFAPVGVGDRGHPRVLRTPRPSCINKESIVLTPECVGDRGHPRVLRTARPTCINKCINYSIHPCRCRGQGQPTCAQSWAGIFKQSMGAMNRVGIGLSYRPARLHRQAEFIPWNRFLGSIIVQKYRLCINSMRNWSE